MSFCKINKDISTSLHKLVGKWVLKRSSYEQEFCNILGYSCVDHKDYDCISSDGTQIEIKKAQSGVWLDLLRYKHKVDPDNLTLILFYKRSREQIDDYLLIKTSDLTDYIFKDFTPEYMNLLSDIPNLAPRQANLQVNLTRRDLKALAIKFN